MNVSRETIHSTFKAMQVAPVTDAVADDLLLYLEGIMAYNAHTNLTALREPSLIIEKHFADCLLVLPYVQHAKRIVDVGSGAGFPGLVLAIAQRHTRYTLVDSLQKRVKFLAEMAKKLGLDHVEVLHERAENLGHDPDHREQYDVSVARAVAPMAILAEYTLPLTALGGKLVAMKGPEIEAELETANMAMEILGGGKVALDMHQVPRLGVRVYCQVMKIKPTPAAYPRRAGIPKKKPLT